ncbi:entry exclusion lipoprotein TrbK [Marinobacter sp.]|uniref:entry exclusion lipoprotein TrbK n=1 Tax=Marinobacter sp. TaxID=50741 RepID=UPI003A95D722
MKLYKFVVISFTATILTGCFGDKKPEVNEENCKVENILSIEEISLREELARKCAEHTNPRTGAFRNSPKKEW